MDHESLLLQFFNKVSISAFGEEKGMPLEAFSLDNDFADKIRKSLKLSNTPICDYLLLPKNISDQIYLIELTDMWAKLLHHIKSIQNNANNGSSKKNKLKEIKDHIPAIKDELVGEVKHKITGTLLMFSRLTNKHSSVSKLFSIDKEYFFALIVPSGLDKKGKRATVLYTNLKHTLTTELSEKLSGRGEISLMDNKAVWSYKSFVAAFKKRHRA